MRLVKDLFVYNRYILFFYNMKLFVIKIDKFQRWTHIKFKNTLSFKAFTSYALDIHESIDMQMFMRKKITIVNRCFVTSLYN